MRAKIISRNLRNRRAFRPMVKVRFLVTRCSADLRAVYIGDKRNVSPRGFRRFAYLED